MRTAPSTRVRRAVTRSSGATRQVRREARIASGGHRTVIPERLGFHAVRQQGCCVRHTRASIDGEWAIGCVEPSDDGTDETAGEFGANEWLVDELYEQFVADKTSVDESWWPVLEKFHRSQTGQPPPAARSGSCPRPLRRDHARRAVEHQQPRHGRRPDRGEVRPIQAKTTSRQPTPQPIPAEANDATDEHEETHEDVATPLRGMAKTLASNMDASLTVPTATSVRTIPAKLMIDNRIVINNHLRRARGGKISFTHLIGWAMVQALKEFPSQNVFYEERDGKPFVVEPAHVGSASRSTSRRRTAPAPSSCRASSGPRR